MKSGSWEIDPEKFLPEKDIVQLRAVAMKHAESGDRVAIRDYFIIRLGLATGLRVAYIILLPLKYFLQMLSDSLPSYVLFAFILSYVFVIGFVLTAPPQR